MAEKDPSKTFNIVFDQALKIPGVKVNRNGFLTEAFSDRVSQSTLMEILEKGPYEAGIKKSEIDNIAKSIIQKRTLLSTSISFTAGLPGGLAMAGTIPADIFQFFGTTLRLAQELTYIYGHKDLWLEEHIDTEHARDTLILYLGVMFGAAGSVSAVKFVSSGFAKEILKKLPHKALTKTLYYPIIKKVAGYIGIKLTKDTFAKGVSKIVPILGGIVSGSITYATMRPMGKKLQVALSDALVITEDNLKKEYSKMKIEFPDIIDINF